MNLIHGLRGSIARNRPGFAQARASERSSQLIGEALCTLRQKLSGDALRGLAAAEQTAECAALYLQQTRSLHCDGGVVFAAALGIMNAADPFGVGRRHVDQRLFAGLLGTAAQIGAALFDAHIAFVSLPSPAGRAAWSVPAPWQPEPAAARARAHGSSWGGIGWKRGGCCNRRWVRGGDNIVGRGQSGGRGIVAGAGAAGLRGAGGRRGDGRRRLRCTCLNGWRRGRGWSPVPGDEPAGVSPLST
jgi:hypothetical protein